MPSARQERRNPVDKLSVFGLLIGLLALVGGQILEGGHIGSLVQPTAMLIVVGGTLGAVMLQDRERSQFIYSLLLLAGAGISTLLNTSPITALSRLAIGDAYTNGWNVAVFAVFLAALYFLLTKMSRRLLM